MGCGHNTVGLGPGLDEKEKVIQAPTSLSLCFLTADAI